MTETNGKVHDAAATDEEAARRREVEERGWAAIERIQERNAHLDPEVVLAEVTAEVEAVRQEMYEQRERAKTSRR